MSSPASKETGRPVSATDLYRAAVANITDNFGVANVTLPNGDTIFCSIKAVAGRSIVRKHLRTSWDMKLAAAEYSKPISHAKAIEILRKAGARP